MKEISYETVLQTLESIVETKGRDYIYETHDDTVNDTYEPTCFYVWDNAPDCGVGRVLHKLGISLGVLSTFEGVGSNAVLAQLEELGLVNFDSKSRTLLRNFQYRQDHGIPWGGCLSEARDRTEVLHYL